MGSVETKLSCFFDPAFVGHGKTLISSANDSEGMIAPMPVTVRDARELQRDASSYASFFDEYGFVLLPHKTAVKEWDGDDYSRYYPDELEKLIHEDLLPGRSVKLEPPSAAMLRGPGTANPFYANTVHADYGLTPQDYVENLTAWGTEELGSWWRHNFEKDQVTGCMMFNFWRSVSQTPIRHMPLCVLDPNSVEPDDVISTGLSGFAPTNGKITNQLSLRYNPTQRWYYYPEMTDEEVLVFKVFHYFKATPNEGLRTCYHTAFEDPDTPADAEHRKSCEQRVFVYLHD